MKPRPILFLNPTAAVGGAEYSLLDLAGTLDRDRFAPAIACFGIGPLVEAGRARGVPVHALALPASVERLSFKGERSTVGAIAAAGIGSASIVRQVRSLLASPDTVLHTNGNKAHVVGTLAAAGRARVVWHVRDFWRNGRLERSLARLANLRARAVIANSHAVAAHLVNLGVRDRRVHAVPNGIDVDRFSPAGTAAALREQFGWPARAPLVGILGMLARWKGHEVLLRAFADVVKRRPSARCVVVGDQIYATSGHEGFAAELRQLVGGLGLTHAVGFTGYREDTPEILRALDVVVHASIEPEPFGRVIAEAMACGRPVIATNAGGAPEVTGPSGTAAVLVPSGDVSAMATAIEQVLADPAAAGRLGCAGRTRILAEFQISSHVTRVERVYDAV